MSTFSNHDIKGGRTGLHTRCLNRVAPLIDNPKSRQKKTTIDRWITIENSGDSGRSELILKSRNQLCIYNTLYIDNHIFKRKR